jgi:hypothetical protein
MSPRGHVPETGGFGLPEPEPGFEGYLNTEEGRERLPEGRFGSLSDAYHDSLTLAPDQLETPIWGRFVLPETGVAEGHRLMRRELDVTLPEGAYLRAVAVDAGRGRMRLIVEWSEPAT